MREKDLLPFFTEDNNLVFCNDIGNPLKKTGLSEYNPSEWRPAIDSSKRSLKCVLLNNGNKMRFYSNWSLHQDERRVQGHLFSLGKDKLPRTLMDDLCRLEDGLFSSWSTKWLHKVSLLFMPLG
jgi:hypothetical protein